jgi:hypothetical protein
MRDDEEERLPAAEARDLRCLAGAMVPARKAIGRYLIPYGPVGECGVTCLKMDGRSYQL